MLFDNNIIMGQSEYEHVILHVDCNGFFASVETVLRPELKNLPMAVCGDPNRRHGIILAKNELAKKYGVLTAETIWKAKQKCPELVLVAPHYDKYAEYCQKCNDIYLRFTNQVEQFGIDESWLDVTGSLKYFNDPDGVKIANEIRETVRRELGITVSVGVSFNKIFAKLGSDLKKPDAVTVIFRGDVERVVHPLPISALLFVGRKTAARLKKMGITTIGALAKLGRDVLVSQFGKVGGQIYEYANGIDTDQIADWYGERGQVKSVGNGETFDHDIADMAELEKRVLLLCASVGRRLRAKKLRAHCVSVALKNPDFEVVSRQSTLPKTIETTRDIFGEAMKILTQIHAGAPIRAATITVSHLTPKGEAAEQTSIFDDGISAKKEKLQATVDNLQDKYGEDVINSAGYFNNFNKPPSKSPAS